MNKKFFTLISVFLLMISNLQSMDYVVQVVQTWGRATEQFGHNNTVIGATALGVAVTVAGTVALQKPENREIAVTTAVPLAVFAGLYKYGPTSGYGPLGNGITGGLITFLALKCWYQKNQLDGYAATQKVTNARLENLEAIIGRIKPNTDKIPGIESAVQEIRQQVGQHLSGIHAGVNNLQNHVGLLTRQDDSGPAHPQTPPRNTSNSHASLPGSSGSVNPVGPFASRFVRPQARAGWGSTLAGLLLFTGALGMRINNL